MDMDIYWAARPTSRESAAALVVRCVKAMADLEPTFEQWYFLGASRPQLKNVLVPDILFVSKKLKSQVTDVDRAPMPELGFSLGIWNGGYATLRFAVGVYSPWVRNMVLLSVPDQGDGSIDLGRWPVLMRSFIEIFDPDTALVVSNAARVRPPMRPLEKPPPAPPLADVSWLVYARGGDIQEHRDRLPPWTPVASSTS